MVDKRSLNKLYSFFFLLPFATRKQICILVLIVFRDLTSSHDHNSTNQAIAMSRYQSNIRKRDNFFSGKQQAAVNIDQRNYSVLIYDFIYDFFLSKDFQSSYINFVISKNSTFFGTTENKWKVTITFDNT